MRGSQRLRSRLPLWFQAACVPIYHLSGPVFDDESGPMVPNAEAQSCERQHPRVRTHRCKSGV